MRTYRLPSEAGNYLEEDPRKILGIFATKLQGGMSAELILELTLWAIAQQVAKQNQAINVLIKKYLEETKPK